MIDTWSAFRERLDAVIAASGRDVSKINEAFGEFAAAISPRTRLREEMLNALKFERSLSLLACRAPESEWSDLVDEVLRIRFPERPWSEYQKFLDLAYHLARRGDVRAAQAASNCADALESCHPTGTPQGLQRELDTMARFVADQLAESE